jgi:hypothetical protein
MRSRRGQMRFWASHECLISARIPRFLGFAVDLMPPACPQIERRFRADVLLSAAQVVLLQSVLLDLARTNHA